MKYAFRIGLCCALQLMIFQAPINAQINWTKDANNPVLRRDTVIANLPNDIYAISDCWVLKEGATFKMWYTCGGLNYPADTLMRARICYCESADGANWTKYANNPVMDVSYSGGWDSIGVETVTVIIDSSANANERYKMWYAGQYFNSYRYDIGYAFSADGITWTKYPQPVLMVGSATEWDNGFLEGPSVIKENGIYKMWYCGYDATADGSGTDGEANVGYATSPDGITWTKYSGNPVCATTPGWDSVYVQDPHVIKTGNTYYMWYGGHDDQGYGQEVGYAWSSDGITWIKSPSNPVLTLGASISWDANTASFPSVINDNGVYRMWYTGKDVEPLPVGSLNYYWEIGYAYDSTFSAVYETTDGKAQVQIYPNPACGDISMLSNKIISDIAVFNATGEQIHSQTNNSTSSVTIPLSDKAAGIYYVRYTIEGITYSSSLLRQ